MTTVVLEAVGVGNIDGNAPTTTSGDNYLTNFFPTGEFGGGQINRAWLMFDIWHIPPDAVVSAASLDITVDSNFLGTSHTLSLYRLKRRCWGAVQDSSGATAGHPSSAASWNNYNQSASLAWGTAGAANTTSDRDGSAIGTLAVTSGTSGTQTITLNTAQIQEWLSGAFVNNGILLQASVETSSSNTLIRWKTVDAPTAAQRPRLTITYTSAIEALALTDNVVAHYRLADTSDASGNAHSLTNNNSVTFISGKVGNAAHFAAASSQSLSNNDGALKPATSDTWTCVFWTKLTDLAALYTAVSQWSDAGPTGGAGWRVFYHQQTILDYFVAQFNDDAGTAEVMDVIGFSSGAIGTAGTYIMLTVRHDAARKIVHLGFNDQMAKANSAAGHASGDQWGPYTASYIAAASAFRIGAQTSIGAGISQPYNGDVDQLTFWNRWVRDDEIAALYNGGVGLDLTFGSSGPFPPFPRRTLYLPAA